ncbi:MAG: cytochrome c oxidase subunit 3 [Halieaceae bacterium]|nr:cytochrome c oxidase subunit 3 [Halieaceae bacterium]
MNVTEAAAARGKSRHLPGEVGLWIFVLGDMLIFSLFFCVFLFYRAHDVATFSASQATLNMNLGALNTLLLLTSSWFVVLGVEATRRKMKSIAEKMFPLAFLCGVGFGVVKFFEYGEKISKGVTLTTNDFYMYYYIFTGIHFLHVLIGMGVLLFLWSKARRGAFEAGDVQTFESGGAYWHMVDLLWIVLFPLLYLVK